jgi:hypothetical protein
MHGSDYSFNTPPRIALCISGAPRLNNDALELFFRFLRSYAQCDIFAYLWHSSRHEDLLATKKLLNVCCDSIKLASVEFPAEYSVTADHEYVKACPTKVENVYKMFYGIKQCHDLATNYAIKNNMIYDYMVRSRSDVTLNKIFDFQEYAHVLDKHVVIPDNGWGMFNFNDQFAVGRPHLMDVYSSTIDYIDYYTQLPDPGVVFHPETLLGFHLKTNSVPVFWAGFNSLLVRE